MVPADTSLPGKILLQWHVTHRCNYRCSHCYQASFSGAEPDAAFLSRVLAQFQDLLVEAGARRGGRPTRGHITVTGGEPFARPDFPALLEQLSAHRQWTSFGILTNGSMIDGATARNLKELGTSFVQISIEGGASTHDRIRGTGSHERAVAALRHLVKAGVRTLISFTAHRQNFREFPQVVELGRRIGVWRVWSDRLIPSGRGEGLSGDQLDPHETREFFEIMQRSREGGWWDRFNRTEVGMGRALQFLAGGGRPYSCEAGRGLITVMPDGSLYPCRRMPIAVGNVRDTPLPELYFSTPLFRSLRDRGQIAHGCEQCFYAGLCRGGLRCLAHAVTGDPFSADPGCWLACRPARVPEEEAIPFSPS